MSPCLFNKVPDVCVHWLISLTPVVHDPCQQVVCCFRGQEVNVAFIVQPGLKQHQGSSTLVASCTTPLLEVFQNNVDLEP